MAHSHPQLRGEPLYSTTAGRTVTTLEPAWLSLAPHAGECFRLYAGNLWEKDVYKLEQKGPLIRLGKP